MEPSKATVVFNPQEEIAKQATLYTNLKQDVFCSTKDKLLLMLRNFRDAVECKQQVATYGSSVLTLLITLVTSDTKAVLGLSAEVWKAAFVIALIICIVLTIRSGWQVFKTRKDRNIDDICTKIMSGDSTVSTNDE